MQSFATAAFIGTFLLPALDRRFSWSKVPVSVVMVGDFLVALGFFIVFLVFRENSYSAARLFINWFLSRKGIDVPKDVLPAENRLVEGRKYLDVARHEFTDMTPVLNLAKEIVKGLEQK